MTFFEFNKCEKIFNTTKVIKEISIEKVSKKKLNELNINSFVFNSLYQAMQ